MAYDKRTPTKTCLEVDKIAKGKFLSIPNNWWKNLTYEISTVRTDPKTKEQTTIVSAKPYIEAIIILADVFYMYATYERENEKGKLVKEKKFYGDKLERKNAAYTERYGFGEKACYDAVKWLKGKNLVTTSSSRYKDTEAKEWHNQIFIEPVIKELKAITDDECSFDGKSWLVETYQLQKISDGRNLPTTNGSDGRNLPTEEGKRSQVSTTHTDITYINRLPLNNLDNLKSENKFSPIDSEKENKDPDNQDDSLPKSEEKNVGKSCAKKEKISFLDPTNKKVQKFKDPTLFFQYWETWLTYKKENKNTYKSESSEQTAVEHLFDLANGELSQVKKIIEASICNGWKGLFEYKTQNKAPQAPKIDISDRTRYEREDAAIF